MEQEVISSILSQIETGKHKRSFIYKCCNQEFCTLYEFRRHLYKDHPAELEKFFKEALHRDPVKLLSKEDLHTKINRVKPKKDKALRKKRSYKKNIDAYPTPNRGDYFRLIYTPMGNKK